MRSYAQLVRFLLMDPLQPGSKSVDLVWVLGFPYIYSGKQQCFIFSENQCVRRQRGVLVSLSITRSVASVSERYYRGVVCMCAYIEVRVWVYEHTHLHSAPGMNEKEMITGGTPLSQVRLHRVSSLTANRTLDRVIYTLLNLNCLGE
jgi:hypothetical protein